MRKNLFSKYIARIFEVLYLRAGFFSDNTKKPGTSPKTIKPTFLVIKIIFRRRWSW